MRHHTLVSLCLFHLLYEPLLTTPIHNPRSLVGMDEIQRLLNQHPTARLHYIVATRDDVLGHSPHLLEQWFARAAYDQ